MKPARITVVGLETSGLDPARHDVVEVAWQDLETGREGVFIPPHHPNKVLANADLDTLRINRYIDRIPYEKQDTRGNGFRALANELNGFDVILAGANPAFDAAFLSKLERMYNEEEADGADLFWHHRLLDVEVLAVKHFGVDVLNDGIPSLHQVLEQLGLETPAEHTALADVRTTATALRVLLQIDEPLPLAA